MNQKFNKDELLATVPVMLHGPKGKVLIRAALSSGSSSTIFNWDTLMLLGYDPVAGQRKRLVSGNSTEFVPIVKIDKIETLGTVKKGCLLYTSPSPRD